MRDRVLLKPGDMAVSCYDGFHGSRSESCFPLGYYEGICLEVDPEAASSWITQNAPAFRVDFSALKEDLLDSKWYMVGSAGSRCEHVFRELYESAFYAERTYLQLKALELLMLLERIPQEAGAGIGDKFLSLCGTDRVGAPSAGSSADQPGGVCISCPIGSRA